MILRVLVFLAIFVNGCGSPNQSTPLQSLCGSECGNSSDTTFGGRDVTKSLYVRYESYSEGCYSWTEGRWPFYEEHLDCRRRGSWSWTQAEIARLAQAVKILEQRIAHPEVHHCAQRFTRKYMGMDRATARGDMHYFGVEDNYPTIILQAWSSADYSGEAFVERAVGTNRQNGLIGGPFRVRIAKETVRNASIEFIAGTIAHEMLHQMGHDHLTNGYSDYNFITTFGNCLETAGKSGEPSLSLTQMPIRPK